MANIETIGVRVLVEGADKAVSDLSRVNKAVGSVGGGAAATAGPLGVLAGALGNVAQIAAGIISAQLLGNLVEGLKNVAQEAIFGAGRVEELEVILELLGTRAGYSSQQLEKWRDAIVDAGIRTDVATKLLAQFIRYQIDASKAVELAALAQDAATFAGEDSTEALAGLLDGILKQRSLTLSTYGVIVNMNQAFENYKTLIGATNRELTASERVQAALNAVLAQGPAIAGAYEAAMGTWAKQWRTLTGRLIPELVWLLGGPFQQVMGSAVFAISDLVKALTAALSEGGKLRPVLDALAAAAERLLAPVIALVRVVTGFLVDTGEAAQTAVGAAAEVGKQLAAIKPPDLAAQFADEAKKIAQVGVDLTKSIARMWDDHNRRLAQGIFDFNLSRLREELDWQRRRERDLEEHNRKLAEMEAELRELRTGERRREIKAQMAEERAGYKEQRAQFVALLGQARSEEERERIKGWIAALDAEHKANQGALKEEMDAIDAEAEALKKRIAMEQEAFKRQRAQEEEDRRLRLAREEEDFQRRITRDEEEVRRRETLQREEAAERITLMQQQMAEEKAERMAAYEEQAAMLSRSVEQQQSIIQGGVNEQKSLVDQWVENFQGLIPVLEEQLVPALEKLWDAWGEFYDEVWPALKPILEFVAERSIPGIAVGIQGLGLSLRGLTIGIQLNTQAWRIFWTVVDKVGSLLTSARDTVLGVVKGFSEVGAGIVQGIIDGVNGMWQAIIDRVRGLAEAIMYELKLRLGIASPSKVFFGYGQEIAKGLAEGIRSMGDLPALQMGQVTMGTLAAVPASTSNVTNNMNWNVTSMAPVSTLAQDYHVLRTMAGM